MVKKGKQYYEWKEKFIIYLLQKSETCASLSPEAQEECGFVKNRVFLQDLTSALHGAHRLGGRQTTALRSW